MRSPRRQKVSARKDAVKHGRLHITKGDTVRVMRGESRGQEGKVLRVYPDQRRVVIDGVNVVKRHKQATANAEGGIIQFPAPIDVSNVMLLDPKSNEATRVRHRRDKDGTVERLSVKSQQPIPRTR